MDPNPDSNKAPRRWRLVVWLVALAGWSVALLVPIPAPVVENLPPGSSFPISKTVHVVVYAAFAWSACLLPGWRWWAVALLLHGAATELGQTFVPGRTGSGWDVALDAAGVMLGLLLARLLSNRRDRSA